MAKWDASKVAARIFKAVCGHSPRTEEQKRKRRIAARRRKAVLKNYR
jgi:hypothetical protein